MKLIDPSRRRSWTPEERALLGTASDTIIAYRLGRTVASVKYKRVKLQLAAAPFERPDHNFKPAEDKLLGTAPDPEIASRFQRGLWSVTERRQELKIPKFDSTRCPDKRR